MTEQYARQDINIEPQRALSVAADTTLSVAAANRTVIADSTGGAITVTLPTAESVGSGSTITVIAIDTNGVTVAVNAADSLVNAPAAANPIILDGGSLTLSSDGGNIWYVL